MGGHGLIINYIAQLVFKSNLILAEDSTVFFSSKKLYPILHSYIERVGYENFQSEFFSLSYAVLLRRLLTANKSISDGKF